MMAKTDWKERVVVRMHNCITPNEREDAALSLLREFVEEAVEIVGEHKGHSCGCCAEIEAGLCLMLPPKKED